MSGGPGPGTGTGTVDPSDGTDDGVDSGGATGDPPMNLECPESLPDDWIFCEDFEEISGIDDVLSVFSIFLSADGRFGPVDDAGASGTHSMRLNYDGNSEDNGYVGIIIGEATVEGDGASYLGERVDELWVQYRTRTSENWPGAAIGRSMRAVTFTGDDWTPSTHAEAASLAGTQEISISAQQCPGCATLVGPYLPLETVSGETPVYDADSAGQWHCIEAHFRLNAPGVADAEIELWVDGEPEGRVIDFDWRGTSEEGWHYVGLSNAWPAGQPQPVGSLYIDDFIVSTSQIGGC